MPTFLQDVCQSFRGGGSRLEDIIVEGGQPNDDKKKTKGGRGVENGRNLVDVIYGCPLIGPRQHLNFRRENLIYLQFFKLL